MPARETFDGAMIILGGALLLTPGFITDIVGFLLLIPPTRALMRGADRAPRAAPDRVRLAGREPAARRPRRRSAPTAASRGYDYEGTAREVTDPPPSCRAARRDD